MNIKLLFLIFYLSLFIFCSSSYAGFKNLVPNSGFEEDKNMDGFPDFWDMKISNFKWEQKGFKGQRSVSVSKRGTLKCKIENIKPHKYYLFSLYIKRDGFMDGEYPYVGIFDREFYLNELFSFRGWVKLSWFLSSNNRNTTQLLLIDPGMTHKLWFDDISLTEFIIKPVFPIHDEKVIGNSIKLTWQMPDTDYILYVKIELSQNKDFKEERVIETVSPMGNFCEIKGLNKGKWYWRISIFKNRKKISVSSIQTFIVLNNSISATSKSNATDSAGLINSKKFFPIGIFGTQIEAFPELKEVGFNSVHSYVKDLDSIEMFITNAKKYNLKALVCIPKEAWEEDVSSFFKENSSSDSILAWYLEDEPEGRAIPPSYIWKLRNYVLKMDPNHSTALVLVRSKKAWDYGPAVDILMIDTYPIPMMPLTWLSESIDEARDAVFDKKPVWAVVQAFDWSKSVREGDLYLQGRNPSYSEEKCLTYLSIVHGAKGVFYYTFKSPNYYIKNYPKHWMNIKRIVKELNQIYPLLLISNASNITISSTNKSIHCAVKFVDEKNLSKFKGTVIEKGYYLIAVNVSPAAVTAKFNIPSFLEGRVLFEDRKISIERGNLVDQFNPYEVHIYKLIS
ncbi:MAG: DUF4962 domain-containing protein [Desulfurellaceae bacterium]|nr:DUF4962 domain-containing protein [Desulfurellaceae bacterium]